MHLHMCLVEIKYTEVYNVHVVAQGAAMKQHSRLLAHLQSKWPQWTVEVLPLYSVLSAPREQILSGTLQRRPAA